MRGAGTFHPVAAALVTGLLCLVPSLAEAADVAADARAVPLRSVTGAAPRLVPLRGGEGRTAMVEQLERRWESFRRVSEELGPHPMSRKGMARRDARIRELFRRAVPEPDTLRVLIIRIAFESDRSGDLTAVTTDGNFTLQPDPEIVFDPPPRNRQYFEAHARALREYWSSMSQGQIVAETRVLPPGNEDAYFLSDIADYGPGYGGFWSIERLERLVQDMIREADQGTLADGSANLADYDFDNPNTHVVFAHAGADLQSNLVWEPGQPGYSPNDIPTFFVTLGDSAVVELESVDSQTGQPGRLTECSVVPETTSQDGLVGAITAALMHEFGHALGLPDLYSTTTGLPAIGYWGIMDSGTNLAAGVEYEDPQNPGEYKADFVTGLLPPQPSIWSRWYLGLVDEKRVGGADTPVDLAASWRQDTRDKVLRIDVSSNEFFLVENRWIPPVADPSWGLTADPATGVVLFMGEYAEVNPGEYQLLGNAHRYDFFMPWLGGLLVWRVRQDRVEDGMEFNTVQGTPTRLGVELVEADGIKDIGIADFATRGFFGSDNDAFRSPSSFAYPGGSFTIPGTSDAFGPDTLPSSRSSFRIPTGASLTQISAADEQSMSMRSSVEGVLHSPAGFFPVELPGRADPRGREIVTGGVAGTLGAVTVSGMPAILVAGAPVDGGPPGLFAFDVEGRPIAGDGRVADLGATAVGAPLVASRPVAGSLYVGAADGTVSVFDPDNGFALLHIATTGSFDTQPLYLELSGRPWVVVTDRAAGAIRVVEISDTDPPAESVDLPAGARIQADPVALRTGGADAFAILVDGALDLRRADGSPVDAGIWPVALPGEAQPDSMAWLAVRPEVDDEVLVCTDTGQLVRVGLRDGSPEAILIGSTRGESPVDEIVLADVDGDGELDAVVTTASRVWAFHSDGAPLRGFPVPLDELLIVLERRPDRFVRAPVVADLDRDGMNEIALTTAWGITHVLSETGRAETGFPRAFSGQGSELAVVDFGSSRALVSFDALGDSLGSERRARPARLNALDLGPSPAAPSGERPAEWAFRGGSMLRAGRAQPGGLGSAPVDPAAGLASAMVLPNPIGIDDEQAFVRYFSGGAHTATVTLYTLEGEEVGRWSEDVQVDGEPAQIAWPAAGLASGPYLCRVDYLGRDGRTTDLKPVYVER